MENNEFEKIFIENCTAYYFDDIYKLKKFNIDNILIDKKWHKSILIYAISYKTLIWERALGIRFYKIHVFIIFYERIRYLTLFGSEKYGAIYDRIRYLINLKSEIKYTFANKCCENQCWFSWFFAYKKYIDFA